MDKKILLQNLADSLSERTGMTKRKAENFVRSFFEITEEGLLSDGVVKVKGFGTTKVVKVNERESVNINTGERFQIEGHAKVTFTPDAPFKDLVNRPFAQFSTIVLEDDVDIEELNAVDAAATETTEDVENDESAEVVEEIPAEDEAPVEEEEAPAEDEETPVVDEETLVEEEATLVVAEETPAEEEETPAEDEETLVENEETLVENEETSADEVAPEALLETADDADDVDSTEDDAEPQDDNVSNEEQAPEDMQQPIIIQNTLPAPPPHNWWRIAFFTLLTVLLMVASYFAGYYRILCPCSSDCIGEQPLPADTTSVVAPQEPQAQQAEAEAPKAEAESAAEAQPQEEKAQPQAEQPQETPAPKGPTAAEREAAKKYRQMEGGEYLITGVIETHKMAVGDNLFKLAKKAYGNKDLASYIIFHNRFANPDVIQLGQDIEIPKLTHK